MNKRRYSVLLAAVFFFVVPMLLMTAEQCLGATYFLDKKLRVKGSVYEFAIYQTKVKEDEKQFRDTKFALMKAKVTLELLYKAVESDNLDINLFGFFRWWHDSVMDFDEERHDSMTRRSRHLYQGPFYDQDDWVNELYVDIYKGPWNIRLGKQIVFWSEVEMVRTIDRINPLDLRYTSPGVDPWDEMKLGLWMMRGFYNSDLPGQIVFEWIWIPGDFEGVRTPREGSPMGSGPAPPDPKDRNRPYGQGGAINAMWRSAQPSFNIRNSTFALRLRGNSEVELFGEFLNLDWTVSWYHGMNTTPVPNRKDIGKPSDLNFNTDTINGYLNQVAVGRLGSQQLPNHPRGAWEYKYFDAVGVSVQTFIPKLRGVVRGEISYEIGVPQIKAFHDRVDDKPSYAKLMTGTTERDQVNIGVTYDVPIMADWLQGRWGSGGVFDTSFGCFLQERLGNVSRIRSTFAYQDRSQLNFTVMSRGHLFHNSVTPVFRALYNTRNFGYMALTIAYTPGRHMRYETGYMYFYAENEWDFNQANAENKDFLYLKIGYEF
jgi:hypothetical protein